jgi:uncharacterized protein
MSESLSSTPDPSAAPAKPLSELDDGQWATLSHFAGILGFLPPLVIWLVLRGRGPRVTTESKESANFQITANAVMLIVWVLSLVTLGTAFSPFLSILLALVYFATLVLVFIAGFRVSRGGAYRYPVNLRLIK